jgi:hypothetical protein
VHAAANAIEDAIGGTMADTSLWPVVVGGLLTGLFALGGIGVGLVGTARRDAAQERREKTKRRADKFEELVAAIQESDHWMEGMRRWAYGVDDIPKTASPFAKVESISAVYFPQFDELISELAQAQADYRLWIYKAERKRNIKDDHFSDGISEAFAPYAQRRDTLIDAIKKFARDEFQ